MLALLLRVENSRKDEKLSVEFVNKQKQKSFHFVNNKYVCAQLGHQCVVTENTIPTSWKGF